MQQPCFITRYLIFSFIALRCITTSFSAESISAHGTPIETNASFTSSFLHQLEPSFTLMSGATISQLGQPQSFSPIDLCTYTYKPQGYQTNILWGGSIGFDVIQARTWRLTSGLGYYQPNPPLTTKGILTQGADPESDASYHYQYQTQHQQLLVEGALYWRTQDKFQPFLMFGIGASFNTTDHYQTSVPPFLEFTPTFSHRTQTKFSYAITPGIEFPFSQSTRIGIAYRWTDLGAAHTGTGQIDGIPISSTLKQSHVYANQIVARLTITPWTRN